MKQPVPATSEGRPMALFNYFIQYGLCFSASNNVKSSESPQQPKTRGSLWRQLKWFVPELLSTRGFGSSWRVGTGEQQLRNSGVQGDPGASAWLGVGSTGVGAPTCCYLLNLSLPEAASEHPAEGAGGGVRLCARAGGAGLRVLQKASDVQHQGKLQRKGKTISL